MEKKTEQPVSRGCRVSLETIVALVGAAFDVSSERFYRSSRNRQESLVRFVASCISNKLCGYEIRAIAEHFRKDPTVMSTGIAKVEQLPGTDKGFPKAIIKIESRVMQKQ